MTSSPAKRRKTDHSDGAVLSDAISAAVRQPTTFVLETAELLAESRFDYERSLEGVDELLRRLKTSIEAIETHEAIPVCPILVYMRSPSSNMSRSTMLRRNSRKPMALSCHFPNQDRRRTRTTNSHFQSPRLSMWSEAMSHEPWSRCRRTMPSI